jgi:hypothetical protein
MNSRMLKIKFSNLEQCTSNAQQKTAISLGSLPHTLTSRVQHIPEWVQEGSEATEEDDEGDDDSVEQGLWGEDVGHLRNSKQNCWPKNKQRAQEDTACAK